MASLSPIAVFKQVSAAEDPTEILNAQLEVPENGAVWNHLVADKKLAAVIVSWIKPRIHEVVTRMGEISDPKYLALGFLAQRDAGFRPVLLEEAANVVQTNPEALNIFVRAAMASEIDPKYLPTIAQYCDRRQPFEVSSQAAVILSKMLPAGQEGLKSFVANRLAQDNESSIIEGYSALATACSVNPPVGAAVFGADEIVSANISSKNFGDENVVLSLLELLSNVCVVQDARVLVGHHFGKFVETSLTSHSNAVKLMATSVRVKLLAGGALDPGSAEKVASELTDLSSRFENFLEGHETADARLLGYAIEGLAATAALPEVRRRVNGPLISSLAALVKTREVPWVFGSLSVLATVTQYPYKETQEQQKIRELRKQAAPSPFEVQEKITIEEATRIVDLVLETPLVPWLAQFASRLSLVSREQCAVLLRNMASPAQRDRRIELASQGAVVIAIYLWLADGAQQTLNDKYKAITGSVIAKVLASIPPEVAFNERFVPSVAIGPLGAQIRNQASERKNLDTFESLLALTNLASIEDDRLRQLMVIKLWKKIEDSLTAEFLLIQRASVELLCNLCTSHACAEIFVRGDSHANYVLSILGKDLTMDDREGRLAAAGALAMLSDWDGAPEVIGHNRDVLQGLISALDQEDDADLLLRVLSTLNTLIENLLSRNDDEAAEALVYEGGIQKIENLVNKVDSERQDVVNLLVRILRLLAKYKVGGDAPVRLKNYKPPPKTSLME